MKNRFIFFCYLLFILNCSNAIIEIRSPLSVKEYPICLVDIPDDPWNYSEDISKHFKKLGFIVIFSDNSEKKADIIAHATYDCHWDVFYRTFNSFNMTIEDATSGKLLASANYHGGFGFNSCTKALNLVFSELKKQLKMY